MSGCDHRQLRVGDRIRILAVPGRGISGFWIHADTRRLFERLVSGKVVLRVTRIDGSGLPWVRHRFKSDDGGWEYHDLAIDGFDEWELVRDWVQPCKGNIADRRSSVLF